jgi:hypothetical protein
VPPGNENGPVLGQLILEIDGVNLVKSAGSEYASFRVCMWGSNNPQLFLQKNPGKSVATALYTIRVSRNLLMKYLNDMATIVIEVYDSRNSKKLGNIFINLKRFQTISSESKQPIVGNFRDKFDVIGKNKQKIGEVTLSFQIDDSIAQVVMTPAMIVRDIISDPDQNIHYKHEIFRPT